MQADEVDVRKVAAEYISKGLAVLPLVAGEKRSDNPDWKKIEFGPEDFKVGDNIGIKSIRGIIVVDIDALEAVTLADQFLPGTGMVYGRPTKRDAKRIYRCKIGETILAFKDGAEMLVEIRVNHQDMAPPSIHPSGERLDWTRFDAPTDVDPELLRRSVQCLATAALIARNYNPPKQRHHWCLALAGELKKIGLKEEEAFKVIKSAAILAGDSDINDREGTIRSTFARGDDEAVSAGRDLKDLTASSADQFVKSLRKIWGQSASQLGSDLLEKMNEKHAVVFLESGSLAILTEDKKDGREFLRYSKPQTMRDLYVQKVQVGITQAGNPVFKSLGAAWLEHPRRREYRGIELNSSGTTEGYYNLWRGFSVEPKKGDWSEYKEHLLSVIANNNREHANWIFDWMASAVQEPTRHAHTAIALQGGQGVGKSTFVEWFGSLFGNHFLEVSSYEQLVGRFNAHLHNALLVFADEAVWAGDKRRLGNLRRMVTQDTLAIERKGFDIDTVPNHVHLLIASNAEHVIPAHQQERRFAIFRVSECRRKDTKFFSGVREQLFNRGGLAALLYDLLERNITSDLREIPVTKALGEQKQHSADAFGKWWFDHLHEGYPEIWKEEDKRRPGMYSIEKDVVYENYVDYAKNQRFQQILPRVHLWRKIRKMVPRLGEVRGMKRKALFPPLRECRKHYEEVFSMEVDWPEDDTYEDPEVPF